MSYPRFNHAHNDYLEFLLTMGAGGLLLFMTTVGTVLAVTVHRKLLRKGVASDALIFGAMRSTRAVLIHAALDFILQIPANFVTFWLTLMLLASTGARSLGRRTAA